jgi:hypothetical protein
MTGDLNDACAWASAAWRPSEKKIGITADAAAALTGMKVSMGMSPAPQR